MKTVDQIYSSIANNILDNCPGSWTKAAIEAQVFNGAVKLKGGYYCGNEYTSFKFRKFDRRIISDFEELHSIMHEPHSKEWNKAFFNLEPNGKFSIDFKWDQGLADEIEALSN